MRTFLVCLALILPHWILSQQLISGRVIDAQTEQPLAYAQVRTQGVTFATLTDQNGYFRLSIPQGQQPDSLLCSFIGYAEISLPYPSSAQSSLTIKLEPQDLVLAEVLITPIEPEDLIRQALDAIPDNVAPYPVNMKAFYREMSKENGRYVELIEAAMDLYKLPGGDEATKGHQARLIRGHRLSAPKESENINVSLEDGSGPTLMAGYPVQADPFLAHFLRPRSFRLYAYELKGISTYQGRDVYVIEIDQDKKMRKKLYQATVLIDVKTLAFASIRYKFSPMGKKFRLSQLGPAAASALRLARLFGIKFTILDEIGVQDYQFVNGQWQPLYFKDYVSIFVETPEKFDGPPELTMELAREMVISEIARGKGTSIPKSERFEKGTDINKVLETYDPDFWQGYNVVAPSESLEEVIQEIQEQKKQSN